MRRDQLCEMLLVRSPDIADLLLARIAGPVERYDARRGSDLMNTLAVYAEENCDRRRAAARLVVHPNTLDYRIRRVEQLTRLRLDDAGDRVLVLLALRWRARRET